MRVLLLKQSFSEFRVGRPHEKLSVVQSVLSWNGMNHIDQISLVVFVLCSIERFQLHAEDECSIKL